MGFRTMTLSVFTVPVGVSVRSPLLLCLLPQLKTREFDSNLIVPTVSILSNTALGEHRGTRQCWGPEPSCFHGTRVPIQGGGGGAVHVATC